MTKRKNQTVFVVTVKWVAEMRPMKLYERTIFYFDQLDEAREFMSLCNNDGHETFFRQDLIMNAADSYENLQQMIEQLNEEIGN